jgi:hypothetical protein
MLDKTIHITLCNVPIKDEDNFCEEIERDFYKRYRGLAEKYIDDLDEDVYKPYKYWVLGGYDILYLTEITNFDFAQKLLIPKNAENGEKISRYNYQIITGVLQEEEGAKKQTITDLYSKFNFLAVINCKINSGLLVGNGMKLTDAIYNKVKAQFVPKEDHLEVLSSFSWFESSFLYFSNEATAIGKFLSQVRNLKLKDLKEFEDIASEAIKFSELSSPPMNNLGLADVFCDTQTYFCINENPALETELKQSSLLYRIDWQIKPGHFHYFIQLLKEKFENSFDFDNISMLTGKSDYTLPVKSLTIELLNDLRKELKTSESELGKHIINFKTSVLLNSPVQDSNIADYYKQNSFRDILAQKFEIGTVDYDKVNNSLKALKISKQIRDNVLKMLYQFKVGISDPVLAIYYVDFYTYIKGFLATIEKIQKGYFEADKNLRNTVIKETNNNVADLEKIIIEYTKLFESALAIRAFNTYNFEDNVSDVNFDFTSSIQQLIIAYGFIAKSISGYFKLSSNYLVQISSKSTISNQISINYSVYDFLQPEFIFYTLLKEILIFAQEKDKEYKEFYDKIQSAFNKLVQNKDNPNHNLYLESLIANEYIDFNRIYVETIRFKVLYEDYEDKEYLFQYWNWASAFKISGLYNISGSFKEDNFISELLRVLFIFEIFKLDKDKLVCPSPIVQSYWDLYKDKLEEMVIRFFANSELVEHWNKSINEYLFTCFDNNLSGNTKVQERKTRLSIIEGSREKNIPMSLTNANMIIDYIKSYIHYIYLKNNARENKELVPVLYRNYENANPIENLNKINKENIFYRIDQTNGVFFGGNEKLSEYFKVRNSVLLTIWNSTMIQLKNYILSGQNNANN